MTIESSFRSRWRAMQGGWRSIVTGFPMKARAASKQPLNTCTAVIAFSQQHLHQMEGLEELSLQSSPPRHPHTKFHLDTYHRGPCLAEITPEGKIQFINDPGKVAFSALKVAAMHLSDVSMKEHHCDAPAKEWMRNYVQEWITNKGVLCIW